MAFTSGSQVAARMSQVAKAVTNAQAPAVRAAAEEVKSSIIAVSPAKLRNVGKNGARLGVVVTVTGGNTPTATGTGVGPWKIIEYPTPKHLIGIGKSGRKRAKVTISNGAAQGGFLKGGGYSHPVRGPVVHPGTHGKLLFHKGTAVGQVKATAVLRKATYTAVKETF